MIRGGDDAIHVAARLKAENIPVILTSTMAAPNREYEGYDAAYSSAAQAAQGGRQVRDLRRVGRALQQPLAVGRGRRRRVRAAGGGGDQGGHDQRRGDSWA